MQDFIYRFRPTDSLLSTFHELENQEIYFASPSELQDPLEGYKDLLWKGDKIAWTNFLRHYLLCLMQAVLDIIRDETEHAPSIKVWLVEQALPPTERQLYQTICAKFFADQELVGLPELLSNRKSQI